MMLPPLNALAASERWLARSHRWLLAALWAAMQVGCWRYYHGPHLLGDGVQYFTYARHLAETGIFAGGYYLRYVGYAVFLSIFIKLHLGLLGIGLAQVGLSGLATCAYYRTALRLSGQHWPTAALATAGLVGWMEVQAFNAFILTESLFTSLLLFSLWALARARGVGGIGLAAGLLVLTAVVRPNGFIALVAAVLAGLGWLHQAGWPGKSRWVVLLLVGLLPLAWARINWLLGILNIMDTYAAGTIIFGYPPASLPAPASLQLPSPAASSLAQIAWFSAHNFRYFSQLAALRLAYFLGFPKPWHSVKHLVWSLSTLPATYWLAARGVGRRLVALPVRTYLATCLLLQMLVIMLTFEDWDVRFSGPLIPYWLLLAALGAQPFLRRWGRRPAAGPRPQSAL